MISVWHQSTARAIREQMVPVLSIGSRGSLMSYTDPSMQRRLKSNAPIMISWFVHKKQVLLLFIMKTVVLPNIFVEVMDSFMKNLFQIRHLLSLLSIYCILSE